MSVTMVVSTQQKPWLISSVQSMAGRLLQSESYFREPCDCQFSYDVYARILTSGSVSPADGLVWIVDSSDYDGSLAIRLDPRIWAPFTWALRACMNWSFRLVKLTSGFRGFSLWSRAVPALAYGAWFHSQKEHSRTLLLASLARKRLTFQML